MPEVRTIGQLAELVGAFCFVEHSLFTLCGQWAAEPVGDGPVAAETTLFLATSARRHGLRAETWRRRLPVRAGVDQDALITAPSPVIKTFERLGAEAEPGARLLALLEVPLTRLLHTYGAVEVAANPATEAPVLAVLGPARREGLAEQALGKALCDHLMLGAAPTGAAQDLVVELERVFDGRAGIFPGEWPS
jgi:hypothetical protein